MCKSHGNPKICLLFHSQLWQASRSSTYGDQVLHWEVSSRFRPEPHNYSTLWFHAGECLLFAAFSYCWNALLLIWFSFMFNWWGNVVVTYSGFIKWKKVKLRVCKLMKGTKEIYSTMKLNKFLCNQFLNTSNSHIFPKLLQKNFLVYNIRSATPENLFWIFICSIILNAIISFAHGVSGGSHFVRAWLVSMQYRYWKRNLFGALMLLQE